MTRVTYVEAHADCRVVCEQLGNLRPLTNFRYFSARCVRIPTGWQGLTEYNPSAHARDRLEQTRLSLALSCRVPDRVPVCGTAVPSLSITDASNIPCRCISLVRFHGLYGLSVAFCLLPMEPQGSGTVRMPLGQGGILGSRTRFVRAGSTGLLFLCVLCRCGISSPPALCDGI